MFARRISVQLKPNKFAEFTKTFESEILPLLHKQQGFRDEITFATPDGIDVMAISLWDTKKNAENYDANTYKDVLKRLDNVIALAPSVVGTTEVLHSTFHHIRAGKVAA
jgi:hypothetical protein